MNRGRRRRRRRNSSKRKISIIGNIWRRTSGTVLNNITTFAVTAAASTASYAATGTYDDQNAEEDGGADNRDDATDNTQNTFNIFFELAAKIPGRILRSIDAAVLASELLLTNANIHDFGSIAMDALRCHFNLRSLASVKRDVLTDTYVNTNFSRRGPPEALTRDFKQERETCHGPAKFEVLRKIISRDHDRRSPVLSFGYTFTGAQMAEGDGRVTVINILIRGMNNMNSNRITLLDVNIINGSE